MKINKDVKVIVEELDLLDRVEIMVKCNVFIMLKDYKFNFNNVFICWLINFIKLEIGCISKEIF